MKLLHTTLSLSLSYGGPAQSVYYTAKGLISQGLDVSVLTFQPNTNDKLISEENFIITLPQGKTSFAYSSCYRKYLEQHPYDLYHAQGIWQYPSYIAAKIAQKQNKPYIISPRGMLYPQALTYSKRKKQIFLKLFLFNDLNKASAIHATCMEERLHLRNLGVKSPIAVIPNPVICENKPFISNQNDEKRIGFIGRFHSIKNIESLIAAFKKVNHPEYSLVLIGAGTFDYETILREKAKGAKIHFTGFLNKQEKEEIISTLSYLVLPSHSENFGMVVSETLIKGIPVIASKGTPWEELNTHNCGWWVDNDVDTLAETIQKAIETPENIRLEMGKRGQELVKNNYSVEVVAKKMIQLYEWILNGGEKPKFVYE